MQLACRGMGFHPKASFSLRLAMIALAAFFLSLTGLM